jgi:small-conductance mechanosensitive channel
MEQGATANYLIRIAISAGVVTAIYLIAFLSRRIVNRNVKDIFQRHFWRRFGFYLGTFINILFLLFYWIENVTALGAVLGGMGAVAALALHKPVMKIFAWIVIITRRIYTVGDRIQIGDLIGDVIDIRLYYTVLLEISTKEEGEQSTGRVVYSPNDQIFTNNVFNHTLGFRYVWHEIPVTITFESDYQKAREILMDILASDELKVAEPARTEIEKMSDKMVIRFNKLTPFVWTKISDFGVTLTMRYLTNARTRRTTWHFISNEVLIRFNQESDIEFAYPTYRLFKRGEPVEIPDI